MALQFPGLQTRIAQRAVAAIEPGINGKIEVGRISIIFFNKIMAHDISITGTDGDTLAALGKLSLSIYPKDLLKGNLSIGRILIENGCFNFIQEEPGYSNLNRIFNYAPLPDSLKRPFRIPDMSVDELALRNMRFTMLSPKKDTVSVKTGQMNFNNLAVRDINAKFNRIRIHDNTISCRIRDLSCREQSGYELLSLAGYFSLDSCRTAIENLHLKDTWSNINAHYLSFGYNSGKDLNAFVNKIVLGADFNNAVLNFKSLGYFAPSLQENRTVLNISGEVTGPVCRLHTSDLNVTAMDSTHIRLSADINGLPDIEATHFDLSLKEISSVSPELSTIIAAFTHKSNNIHTVIPSTRVTLDGSLQGTLHDAISEGRLSSADGNIGYKVSMIKDSTGSICLNVSMNASDLNLGKTINSRLLGKTDLYTSLRMDIPQGSFLDMTAYLDTLHVNRIEINGYKYSDIDINGTMKDRTADIRMISHDSAFPTLFQGVMYIGADNRPERVKVFLDVPYADLKAMNIVNKGSISNMGITAGADLRLTDHSILGNVLLDNISYANDNGQYHIDSLYIRSEFIDSTNIISIQSPAFRADYSGTGSPTALAERLKLVLRGESLKDVLDADTALTDNERGRYDFHLKTLDMSQICDIIRPGFRIADSTTVSMLLSADNTLDFRAQSSSVSFCSESGKDFSFHDIMFSLGNSSAGHPHSSLTVGRIRSGNILLDNCNLQTSEENDKTKACLTFNNADTTYLNLSAAIGFSKSANDRLIADIAIDSSTVNIRNHRWELAPSSIIMSNRYYSVSGFHLIGASDSLSITGTLSDNPNDVLSLTIDNIDLSVLNSFLAADMDLKGSLSGKVALYEFFSGMGISMEIEGSGLNVFGKDIGTINALSRRDMSKGRFNVLINNYLDGNNPLNLSGYYIPERKYMNLNLALDDLQMSYLSPILSDYISIDSGHIRGNINIAGQSGKFILNSENCYLDSLLVTPAFTKVPYILDGPISLRQRRIELNDIRLIDPSGSTAVLQGNITHDSFKDIYIDAGLSFNDFLCLSTAARDNSAIYGTAHASGSIVLSGYTDNLLINARLATKDNSSIHIPLSSTTSASSSDLISYVDFRIAEDSIDYADIENGLYNKRRHNPGNIELRAVADISQGTELIIEMNRQFGGTLRCSGNGILEFTYNPSRNVTDLRGDYTISEGSYHLTLSSIQSRDFILDEGGSIAFNGDLRNTSLNVGATYRTKASISTLIADTTSVGNRRNVDCGIQLQGTMSNPEVSFSIDIPDLDPITKGRVESALSTPDKVLKQVMALLISGSFVPDEQSGIVNNSTILYTNASEILSNQVNNIFRQFDIPLDLGLNYQPGTANGGKDMFDVAISYQAFNNRLIINGNVGNSENSSNWAGDFEAEIKVDRQGKLRVTLFTRSADSYSNYLDNTQRSGFGITYQDEFDSFGDFLRNIFYTRKRKEEYELMLMKEAEAELEKEAAEANIRKENVMKPKEDPMNLSEETGYVEYQAEN